MKRKIFIFILAVVFVLSLSAGLSACGSSGSCSGDTAGTDGNTENNGSDDTEHVHNFIRTEAVAATCTSEGNIEYWYCSDCGKYYSDADGTNEITLYDTVTSKLEHTVAVIEGVAATCTESGLTEGSYCSVCGEVLAEQEVIAATGHTLSSWIVTKEATATEMGSRHKVCTVCGEEVKAEPIIITKETEGLEYAEVLDGAGNVTGYKVTGVGSVTDSIIYVPAEYNSLPVTGVCQQAFNGLDFLVQLIFGVNVTSIDRYAVYNCENLTDIFIINEDVEIDGRYFVYLCDKLENVHFSNNSVEWEALGLLLSDTVSVSYDFSHDYVLTETVAATCVQDGYNVYVCADCGRQYSEVISAAGHSWSVTESVDATCEDYGYNKAVCTVCGEEKNLITEATGHTVEEWEVISEADCENNGLKIGTCTVCGESVYSYDYATGHVAGAIVYSDDSYCGEDKTGTVTCTVCGEILYSIGHNYVSTIKQATCEEDGLITYTCSKCGDVYTETLECGGHIEGEWQTEKAATCYSEGLEILCCLVCEKTINSQTISKTAHSYASTRSSSEIVYTCTVCGYSYTEELASDSVLYTVNFVSNGGTEYDSLTVLEGAVVELPEPECSGYEFIGWFTDESLTTLYDDSAVTQNLTLYAGWTMAVEASGESNTIETSAPKDFTFDVVSDRSLTKNNLSKYITVTDIDEKSVGIHISKTEGSVYTIAADSDYEAGATYIITIDPEMSFVDYDGYELWIIIECEDYYDIEYKSGVVLIQVDEVYGCYSDGDNAYIYLYEDKLDVGDVAVIYDTSIYDIQYTLEVTVEGIYDRYYAYQVIYADTEEVFENYEVYSSGELSLEDFVVSDGFIEEIEEQFVESALYKQFVIAAEAFDKVSGEIGNYYYDFNGISAPKPSFNYNKANNTIVFSITVTATFSRMNTTTKKVDDILKITLVFSNTTSLSANISTKSYNDFTFLITATNTSTVKLYASLGGSSTKDLNYFKQLFQKSKEAGENAALDSSTASKTKDADVGSVTVNFYGIKVGVALKLTFTFEAVGEIGTEASVTVKTTSGIVYTPKNGLKPKSDFSASASASFYVMGKISVSASLSLEATVSFLGLVNASLGVSAGPYFEMGGMFAVTVSTKGNAVVAGGYLEVGVKLKVYCTLDISMKVLWWKVTFYKNTWTIYSTTWELYKLGTKSMPLYYNVKNESFEIPLDVSQSYDLTKLVDSYIVYQSLTSFTTSTQSVTSSYSIIGGSKYFSLTSDGKLTLKSTGGNTSFTLQIKVYNGSIYKTVTIKVNVTHNEVSVDYVAPTCSSEGQTAYTYCSVCGEILSGTNEVIAKTDHDYTVEDVSSSTLRSQATCAEKETHWYICSMCGAVSEAEYFEVGDYAPHTYSGYTYDLSGHWQTCVVCGENTQSAAHTYDSDDVCTICGYKVAAASEGLEYTLSTDKTYYTVSGIGTCTDTNIVIPSTYNGLPVTAIAANAFKNQTQLTSVYVSDSVTSIGLGAFSGCSSLVSITLPFVGGSVKTEKDIWQYPFGYIFGTTSYTGGTITQQYYHGISTNSTTDAIYYIPTTLTIVTITGGNILCGAFYGCYKLTSITIPNSVTSIGDDAFCSCISLTSITIPDSVTSIGGSAFHGCTSLTSVTIPESVTSIGSSAFSYCTSLTSITIPDSVTSIGNHAFENCTSLTSITIPDSVTSIGSYAFSLCTSLISITIGDSVTSIGSYAFYVCHSLTSINVNSGNKTYKSIDGNLYSYDGAILIQYALGKNDKSFVIPESVTSIGERALGECYSLTSVTIGNGVTTIGDYAFENCTSLISVTIGDSVTAIGNRAFYCCTSLTSVTIPDSVTSIGSSAFSYCTSLTSVTIPDSVTSIGDNAFSYCTSLASVTMGNGVSSIDDATFESCYSLTSITIGDSVTSIGEGVFYGCTSLTSINVSSENKVYKSIDGNLYSYDGTILIQYAIGKADTLFTIPDSVTSIGNAAFSGCTSLTSVSIPNSVTSIGNNAFNGCTSLISVTIPNSVTTIEYCAFIGCDSLTSVSIPDSVTSIGNDAFGACYSLTSVSIPDSVTSIGNAAFFYCTSFTSVSIPDSVTSIGNNAFMYCYSLTSVTIGNSVTTIGNSAFNGCTSLTTVYYNGTAEEWNSISIGSGNTYLTNATIYYSETQTMAYVGNSYILDWDELTYYANGKESAMLKSQAAKYVEYLTVTVNFIDSGKAEIVFDIAENSYITSGTYTLTSGYQLTGETFTFTDCTWDNEDAAKYIGNAEEIANSGLVTLGWDGTNVTILISINDLVDLLGNSTASALISLLGTCTASGYMQPV